MRNTTALVMILLGGMLIYGGYKDYSFADTIRFFTGQKLTGNGSNLPGLKNEGDLNQKSGGTGATGSGGSVAQQPVSPSQPGTAGIEPGPGGVAS